MLVAITTIAEPTHCVKKLVAKISGCDGHLVVAGDRKGPTSYELDSTTFFLLMIN